MVKFRKLSDKDIKNNALCQWLSFFDVNTPEKELQEVIKMNTAISKADERYQFVTQDKNFLRDYHRRLMEMSDWTTGMNTAMEKGMEKGRLAIAKNALSEGASVDFIQKITGLKEEIILSLKAEQ